MKKQLTSFWLLLSSFGIMFAILSWVQESMILDAAFLDGSIKGFLALFTGFILYALVAKQTL